MIIKIDLSDIKNNAELLRAVASGARLNVPYVNTLDRLYSALVDSDDTVDFIFTNKDELSEEVITYFGIVGMTIEEAGEARDGITIKTYYGEEEDDDRA